MNDAPVELVNVKSSFAVILPISEHAMPYAPNVPTGLMFGDIRAYNAFAMFDGKTIFEVPIHNFWMSLSVENDGRLIRIPESKMMLCDAFSVDEVTPFTANCVDLSSQKDDPEMTGM